MTDADRYLDNDRAAVYRVIRERRAMRHFRPDPVDPAVLGRLLEAARLAPSVGNTYRTSIFGNVQGGAGVFGKGFASMDADIEPKWTYSRRPLTDTPTPNFDLRWVYMQPWPFLRTTDPALRRAIHALVQSECEATAQACSERENEVRKLKLEGILECGEIFVAALCEGRERYILGRRTLPETDTCSVACAIQNLWLAARAEGLEMGWVSLFDPEDLARLLNLPGGAWPVAVICLGHVDTFYPEPLLETAGWDTRRQEEVIVFENGWGLPADLPTS